MGGSIDLILTDPPWGILKKGYDNNPSLSILKHAEPELFRLLRAGGHLLLDMSFVRIFDAHEIIKQRFVFRQPIILYCNNQIGHRGYAGWNHFRLIMWYGKSRTDGSPPPIIRKYRDVIEFPMISLKQEAKQGAWTFPNPKSVKTYKTLIEMFSKKEDLVLDPFMGSGTTVIACHELNRRYIGIEINEEYANIARARVKLHQEQMKLTEL